MSRPINEDDVIKIIRMMPPENGITAMIEQGIKQLPSAQRESCEYWDAESNYCTLNRPSAQPERKKGRWEIKPDPYGFFEQIPVCSECGCTTKMRDKPNFCPNCGADMRGEQDDFGRP